MSNKILVTGANGMLGQDLCPILEDNGYEVIETDIHCLDITNKKMVEEVLYSHNPDIVIHCAAYTNVDKAEEDFETAYSINVKGTENIAKVCKKNGAKMVYISTDYVFNGDSKEPYKPNDKANPINKYGLTKLEGEKVIKQNLEEYYICRTSWLYGHHGKNFIETMISLAGKPEINVVNDQTGCPTWTIDLANTIVEIIEDMPYGTYHTCGAGETTWYNYAKKIFELSGLNVNLLPCSTDEFPRAAKRPAYSVMDNGGLMRDWESALKEYIALRPEVMEV